MRATLAWLWSGTMSRHRDSNVLRLDPNSRSVLKSGRRIELTAREFSLLEHLVQHAGESCAERDLLVSVWGTEGIDRQDVLATYVHRLRRKLGDDLIEPVPGEGYRLRSSEIEKLA